MKLQLKSEPDVFMTLLSSSVILSPYWQISLNVRDANDRPPVFTSRMFEWAITEVSPLNFTVGQLTATDDDFNPEHTVMKYEISYQV